MNVRAGVLRRGLAMLHRPAAGGEMASVAEALQPEAILLDAVATDQEGVLRLAAGHFETAHGLCAALVFDALRRREQAGSTALGAGVAIPHARLPGIRRAVTVFIRLKHAIAFDAADGVPVSDLLVIAVPRDGADGDHLRMLALIAELFSKRGFRRQLRQATTTAMADAAFRKGIGKSLGVISERSELDPTAAINR